jgi:hypothetical protein
MANTKISALPAATTPLAGTEVLPIVQGGITEQVAVNDLTVKNVRSNATTGILQVTGPAAASTCVMTVPNANFTAARTDAAQSFTGDQTLSTGNLVIGTSGKGIDFSATPGTGTSELFDDYEEGTWTGTLVPGTSGTITMNSSLQTGSYTKVGRLVTVTGLFYVNSVSSPVGTLTLTGLPYATPASNYSRSAPAIYTTVLQATATSFVMGYLVNSTSEIIIAKLVAGAATAMAADVKADSLFAINLSYVVE